jgi:hypothetical protein
VLGTLASKAIDFGAQALGKAVGGVISDKPNNFANPLLVTTIAEPSLSAMEGVTYADVLDETIGEQYLARNPPVIDGELNLDALCARYSYYGRFKVDTLALNEDVLFSAELSPTAEVTQLPVGVSFQPTMPCWLSLMATFWRCDSVNFRITMVGAEGHTARLAFLSNFGGFEIPTEETYSQFVQIVDFSKEQPTVEISIPWRSPRDQLRVSKGYDIDRSRYAFGLMYTRLVGALQATELISSEVEFLVFISFKGMRLTDFSTGPADIRVS